MRTRVLSYRSLWSPPANEHPRHAGWFILLTSLLGFWRVKRWERGILSSQDDVSVPSPTADGVPRSSALIHSIERAFGLQGLSDGTLLRQGLGFPGAMHHELEVIEEEEEQPHPNAYILPLDPSDSDRNERIARAYADEARLQQDLRSAGLL